MASSATIQNFTESVLLIIDLTQLFKKPLQGIIISDLMHLNPPS